MKKLFIIQSTKGKTEETINAERNLVIEKFEEKFGEDISLIEPYSLKDAPANSIEALYYLGKNIELLSAADIAYLAPGWKNDIGCLIGFICAKNYGIDVYCPGTHIITKFCWEDFNASTAKLH